MTGNVKLTPINHKIVYRSSFMKYSIKNDCRVRGPAIGRVHEIASPVNLSSLNIGGYNDFMKVDRTVLM
jgi:hypothetical protein